MEEETDPSYFAESMAWRSLAWADENGQVSSDALTTAKNQRDVLLTQEGGLPQSAGIDASAWVAKGPANVGGRTRWLTINPGNPNMMWASSSNGIQRSTNGGNTWTTTFADSSSGAYDIVFHPTASNQVVAGINAGALYSTNGGTTWQTASISNLIAEQVVKLAYVQGNPSIVYLSGVDSTNRTRKIWRSTDGGRTYGAPVTASDQLIQNQGSYTDALWVCPTNSNFLLVGGTYLYKSTDGGAHFTQISDNYFLSDQVHADQQFIVSEVNDSTFDSNPRVYACTDGGIFRTNNIFTAGTFDWTSLNQSYQTTQFYDAAGSSNYLIGGTQDNGTLRVTQINPFASALLPGDGGESAVDPTNDDNAFAEQLYLTIQRSTDKGLSSSPIYSGISDAGFPTANQNGTLVGFTAFSTDVPQ